MQKGKPEKKSAWLLQRQVLFHQSVQSCLIGSTNTQEKNDLAAVACLDFQKAFGNVPYQRLIWKLSIQAVKGGDRFLLNETQFKQG